MSAGHAAVIGASGAAPSSPPASVSAPAGADTNAPEGTPGEPPRAAAGGRYAD